MWGASSVNLDANQPGPEYADGDALPDTSEVRLLIEQAISHDLADRRLLLSRRRDVTQAFSRLHGSIGL